MAPTPPSVASSLSGHSPEGQYRVIRKRNRVPLSCGPCRQRKLKCNRSHPCENCVKRGDASSCSYAQPTTRKKAAQQSSVSASPDDMQNRIDRLEGLVLSLMTNGSPSTGPAVAMEAISGSGSSAFTHNSNSASVDEDEGPTGPEESDTEQVTKSFGVMKVENNKSYYFSDAHWASILSDIAEVRNYFNTHKKQYEEQAQKVQASRTPTDVPGSALLFGASKPASRAEIMSSFPSKYTTDILVARYFSSYDPATYILHGPTFQASYNKHWEDPSQTCIVWVGMLFAIMRLAMLSYYREGDEPPEFRGKTLDMAGSFRNLMAQCLTLADYTKPYRYLIETLLFHLHGDFCQAKETDVSVWVLVGVIARLAMRMGYHRDSKMFPNITPFQGEMRRRIWTFIKQADLLFSFQVGLPSMLRSTDSDTEIPRNLYDDDFSEDCKELPSSRPPDEPTPICFLITKARLSYAFGHVVEHTSSVQGSSYDQTMESDAELRRAVDMVPEYLQVRPIEECQQDPSNVVMSRFSVMSVYHKAQCVLHRRYLARSRHNPRFTYSRRTCIDSALELLRYQSMLHEETKPSGRLRGMHNRVTSLSCTDFLLAATIICLDLHHGLQLQNAGRPSGDVFIWGRERREELLAVLRRTKDIWDELRDETLEAWKAAAVLGVMLSKLNMGPENGAIPTPAFEPQDEKQSAAMTLGLLSSGMSPMNNGPPPTFADPSFKMLDPSLAPGGLGTSADIAAAPSPFSSMFGQMPDMQLDWDAWDTYIQNSTLDAPNQWWPMTDSQQPQPQTQPQQPSIPLPPPQIPVPQNGVADATAATAASRFPGFFPPPTTFNAVPAANSGASMAGMYNSDSSHQPNGSGRGQNSMHCLRRTALRLLISPATATTTSTPARTRSITALHRPTYIVPRQPPQCRLQQQQRQQQRRWNSDEARRREYEDEVAGKQGKAVGESESGLRTPTVEGEGEDKVEVEVETETETIASTNDSQITSTTTTSTRTSPAPEVTETTPVEAQAEADARANVNPDGTEGRALYSRSKKVPAKGAFRYVEEPGSPKETVFVSNLFFDINADDLRQHMEQFGVVENAIVITDSRGISKGFGYVTFDTTETAALAIDQVDGTYLEGRPVFVSFARANTADMKLRKPYYPPSRTIYIGRIPPEMSAADLHALFDDVFNVIDIRVSVDRRTGQLRGFAHAEFLNVESARDGYEQLGRKRPYGKPLRLDYSHTNRKLPDGSEEPTGPSALEVPVYSGPATTSS